MKNLFFCLFLLSNSLFPQQFAAIVSKGIGTTCIINEKEEIIFTPPSNMKLARIQDGIVSVRTDGKYGYANCFGNEILPAKYERAEDFFDNRARVRENGKWCYINKRGEIVIPAIYKHTWDFREGIALVNKGDG